MRRALALAALLLCACAPPVWDVTALEARQPRLRALGDHRLGDTTPYLLPAQDTLVLFLCRWPTEAPIPVSLPSDATAEQRRAIDLALDAWEGAGLGVRFVRGAAAGPGIELRLVTGEALGAGARRIATSVADCALDPAGASGGDPRSARMVSASIELRGAGSDILGRPAALEPAELAGAVLHELGHALGFQGHVRVGSSAMRGQPDEARRAGRRLLAGERFSDPTLRALYQVPSGTVVGRLPVSPGRTRPVDGLLALALSGALSGPLARMGDLEGQILFRDEQGEACSVWLRGVASVLRGRPDDLVLVPGPRASLRLSLRRRRGGRRARGRPSRRRSVRARAARHRGGTA